MSSERATVEARPSAPNTQRAQICRPSARITPRTGSSSDPPPRRPTTLDPGSTFEDDASRSDRAVEASHGGESSAGLVPESTNDALVHRHRVLGQQLIEDAELIQPGHPAGPEPVGGDRRARELVAVHDQHVPIATRECNGQRRARAAGADDDRVVVPLHRRSLRRGCRRFSASVCGWPSAGSPGTARHAAPGTAAARSERSGLAKPGESAARACAPRRRSKPSHAPSAASC